MNYAAYLSHFAPYFTHKASPKTNTVVKKPGVLWRIFDAIVESRQKQADQKIALWLARSGGRFTDNIERQQGDLTAGQLASDSLIIDNRKVSHAMTSNTRLHSH